MTPNVTPVRTLPSRGLDFVRHRLSRFGERHQVSWLTYNPLQLRAYHHMALTDAHAVMGAIIDIFPWVERLADIGAGSGAFAGEAMRLGKEVEACEYALAGRLYARYQRVKSRRFDLTCDPPARLRGQFDLAYCFEVAEHCPPTLADPLVAFLSQVAPIVVFTAARPGQGGLGHVNEQEPGYWIERFNRKGMPFSVALTHGLRMAFGRHRVTSSWFFENLMVFAADVGTHTPHVAQER